MLNLQKNNNYGFSGSNNKNNNINNYNNNNNTRTNSNVPSTNSYNSDNANLQVYNIIKEVSRKKNNKVSRDDILQLGEQKLRDRSKVDKCINNLLSEGFIMEEDDIFSVIANYTG
jgi:hypothetical protein